MMAAFAGNDAFHKTAASGRHIRTKIVTIKDQLEVGQAVSRRTWSKANKPIKSNWTRWTMGLAG
jgi:hypothetical protein